MHHIRKFFLDAFQIDIPVVRGDGTQEDPYHLQLSDVAQNGYFAELFATCWFQGMEAVIKTAVRWKIVERDLTGRGYYRLTIHRWIVGQENFEVDLLHFSYEPATKQTWNPAVTHDDYLVVPQKLSWATYVGRHIYDDPRDGYSYGWNTKGVTITIYVYPYDDILRRSAAEIKAGVQQQVKLGFEAISPTPELIEHSAGPTWMGEHAYTIQFKLDGGTAYGIISVSHQRGLFFKNRITVSSGTPRMVVNETINSIQAVYQKL